MRCRPTLNWTVGGRQAGKERGRMEDGREGARGGSVEAMMRGRMRAGVEEGRFEERNYCGRNVGMDGARERWDRGRKRAERSKVSTWEEGR